MNDMNRKPNGWARNSRRCTRAPEEARAGRLAQAKPRWGGVSSVVEENPTSRRSIQATTSFGNRKIRSKISGVGRIRPQTIMSDYG